MPRYKPSPPSQAAMDAKVEHQKKLNKVARTKRLRFRVALATLAALYLWAFCAAPAFVWVVTVVVFTCVALVLSCIAVADYLDWF